VEDDSTKTMTVENLKILPIANASEIEQGLRDLAAEWTAIREFWTLDSCMNTMNSNQDFLSAALVEKEKGSWLGWYLANTQGHECELLFIYTAKLQRGKGLANRLMKDLLDRARKKSSLRAIFLEVRPSNIAAIKLYESHGFAQISRRTRYYSNGEDALVYRLEIKN